jgi:Flp pilus assembly protein TadB
MSLAHGRRGPLFHFIVVGVGVALIVFALIDTTASRLVFVVGGVAIVAGMARGMSQPTDHRRNSTDAPSR